MARLGSAQRPAVVHVRSMLEAARIVSLCDERGWQVVVGIEPDKPEDVSDLNQLLGLEEPQPGAGGTPAVRKAAAGRNDPCPCGSGLKYKRCCA